MSTDTMRKVKSRIFKALFLAAGLAIGLWAVRPFVAARGSIHRASKPAVAGAVISGMPSAWREIDGRIIPPLGTSSATPWKGLDSLGHLRDVPACNCFESVNYLTTGSTAQSEYRTWPAEALEDLEENATWDKLEHSLRPGDVVEFIAKVTTRTGSETTSPFHAQLCVSEGGLMAGANNEPQFRLINGIPTPTNVWYVCTSRQYYLSARAMDAAWDLYGNNHVYRVMVYRHPK